MFSAVFSEPDMADAFRSYDPDNKGFVLTTVLYSALTQEGNNPLSTKEADALVAEMDPKGTGRIFLPPLPPPTAGICADTVHGTNAGAADQVGGGSPQLKGAPSSVGAVDGSGEMYARANIETLPTVSKVDLEAKVGPVELAAVAMGESTVTSTNSPYSSESSTDDLYHAVEHPATLLCQSHLVTRKSQCPQRRAPGSEYCNLHTCQAQGCNKLKPSRGENCNVHNKSSK
jgi:hypothetical protein